MHLHVVYIGQMELLAVTLIATKPCLSSMKAAASRGGGGGFIGDEERWVFFCTDPLGGQFSARL